MKLGDYVSQTAVELNSDVILYEEKEEVKKLDSNLKEQLKKIFIKAAQKLEQTDAFEDTREICAYLSKSVWPEHARHLRLVLPEKYKHCYTKFKKEEEQENDSQETKLVKEFLKRCGDLFYELSSAFDMMLSKLNQIDDPQERTKLGQQFMSQFGSTSDSFQKELDKIKEMEAEVSYIKSIQDDRIRLGEYEKVMVKAQLLVYSKHDIAKKLGMCSKWIKQGVQDDPEIERGLDQIKKCMNCGFDIADWYRKQKKRFEKGLKIQEPEHFPNINRS